MKLFVCLPAFLLLLCAAVLPASAQIVQVGAGGSVTVRAPFVRVYVGPNGETHVRAPFTEINTPGYGNPRYGYPTPSNYVVPQAQAYVPPVVDPTQLIDTQQLSEMTWRQLRVFLRSSAAQLDQDLVGPLASWEKLLSPKTIRDLITEDTEDPLDQETAQRLQPILAAYTEATQDEVPSVVANLVSFENVRQSLSELLLPPLPRLRGQLISGWQQLEQDLNSMSNGESLKSYLAIPKAILDENSHLQPAEEELDKAITNYEALNRTSDFRAVAQLTSFQATRQRLAQFRQWRPTSIPAPPTPEELELPPPKN